MVASENCGDRHDGSDVLGGLLASASTSPTSSEAKGEKWWHVPDNKIEELVQGMREQHAGSEYKGKHAPKRSVRFEDGGPGDALDQLLRRSFIGQQSGVQCDEGKVGQRELRSATRGDEEEETEEDDDEEDDQYDEYGRMKPKKWWRVSNRQLKDKIAEIVRSSDHPPEIRTRENSTTSPMCKFPTRRATGDGKITVHVFIVDSGDTLTLRVNPDLKLGPAKPPTSNAFTQMYGQGASTKGFDSKARSFDYRRREFGNTQRPGWLPEWSDSLKETIAKVMNIAPSRQKLSFRLAPITIDDLTLQSYGIGDGDTLKLRVQRLQREGGRMRSQSGHREVRLACTRRREEARAQQSQQERCVAQPGCGGPSLRGTMQLKECRSDGDVWMMPRWISQANPQLFASVGIGVDGEGGQKAYQDFGSQPIFLTDANDSNFSRVREAVHRR